MLPHTRTHTHTHVHTRAHTHIHTRTYTHAHTHTPIHTHTHARTHAHTHILYNCRFLNTCNSRHKPKVPIYKNSNPQLSATGVPIKVLSTMCYSPLVTP